MDDAELSCLGNECPGAVETVELQTAFIEFVEEFIGGDVLPWLDDIADDVAEGVMLHDVAFDGFCHSLDDLMRQIVVFHGKKELGITIGFDAETLDKPYLGNALLCGDTEDTIGCSE